MFDTLVKCEKTATILRVAQGKDRFFTPGQPEPESYLRQLELAEELRSAEAELETA